MPVMVTLTGPAPWGFRITGGRDFGKPITVSKVTEHGKAAAGDLRPGDVIVTINGESAAEMLNVEAQNKIKQSPGQLRLQVERWSPSSAPLHPRGVRAGGPRPHPGPRGLHLRGGCSWEHRLPLSWGFAFPASPGPLSRSRCREGDGRRRRVTGMGSGGGAAPGPPGVPLAPAREGEEKQPPHAEPWSIPVSLLGSRAEHPSLWGPGLGKKSPWARSGCPQGAGEEREGLQAPFPSSTFRLLQEALEDEGGAGPTAPFPSRLSPSARKPVAGVQKLHVCEKCGSTIATQAVRIQDGRYRHPSCYACADCGLNLKMRGHFWVGDELYCEKPARLRYQGTLGGPATLPVSPHS
ncbi:PDLI1 protein, partial [Sagittarius serpentarius]|nr:PDLI1 protein [Sagittarius serpentarius]